MEYIITVISDCYCTKWRPGRDSREPSSGPTPESSSGPTPGPSSRPSHKPSSRSTSWLSYKTSSKKPLDTVFETTPPITSSDPSLETSSGASHAALPLLASSDNIPLVEEHGNVSGDVRGKTVDGQAETKL